MWVNCLTYTMTHIRKCPERFEAHRIGSFASYPVRSLFSALFLLHDLFHEGSHGLGRFVLLLPRSVGIGAEGESGIVVTQSFCGGLPRSPDGTFLT